ncbi:MAG: hypothetical protein ACE5R6_06100 [Candidatus Heimdallarchaeota archaeon]
MRKAPSPLLIPGEVGVFWMFRVSCTAFSGESHPLSPLFPAPSMVQGCQYP